MKILFHPEFASDQRKFEADYAEISPGLAARFRAEVDTAITAVKVAPTAAGHFVFGAIIPTRSDPLRWLARFPER